MTTMNSGLTIAIDFDGTCVTHEYPYLGTDIGAEPVLKELVAAGHKLILYTMRSDKLEKIAVEWFKERNIPLYAVNINPEQKKWTKFLNNCKFSFILMMLLPCFPDDILCLVAGLTDMSWTFFMVTQFITRPIGIFSVSIFSSGSLIPYHGWGLIVWTVIFILAFLLIYLSNKKRP